MSPLSDTPDTTLIITLTNTYLPTPPLLLLDQLHFCPLSSHCRLMGQSKIFISKIEMLEQIWIKKLFFSYRKPLEESSLQGRHWLSLLFWSSSWKLLIEEILCKWSNCEITSSHRVVSLAGQPGEVDAVYFCLSIDNSILHSIIGTFLWAETSRPDSPLIGWNMIFIFHLDQVDYDGYCLEYHQGVYNF